MQRRRWLGMLAGLAALSGGLMSGCSSDELGGEKELGTLSLPLSSQGPSGTEYRLRDAVFEVSSEYYYYDYASGGAGGEGGSARPTFTVSSEDDPSAATLSLSVERGYYYVRLRPGWRMEKIVEGEATTVETTLLSSATQWVYVGAHSTSWVEFEFGIGERSVWFNGDLNIGVRVYEDPEQYYGGGWGGAPDGFAGQSGLAGAGGG